MKEVAIKLEHISMEYRKTTEKIETLKEYIIRRIKGKVQYDNFRALDDISYDIIRGERIGIIGANGAGKSTMMKIIAQVMKPTSGRVTVNGTVAPMLELGAGFDLEFSGYDNIFLNAALLGRSKEFIESKLDNIIAFADLGDFIYSPIKNYSSGMRAKLGFAVATEIEPDIVIIDEVLGVGDVRFRKKSSDRIKEIIESGATAIIVSHNIDSIKDLTEKTIWLDKGKVAMIGETNMVCKEYLKYMQSQPKKRKANN